MIDVELVGNALCLDFTNTVNSRPVARRDWLATPDEAVTWARAAGRPIERRAGLATALPDARDLRETVFRVFRPLTDGDDPPRTDLDVLTAAYADGLAHARFERDDGRFRFAWPAPRTAGTLLREVAASAVDLLAHGPLERIHACPSCQWLFLDTSKNGRRRWCSMTACGSRDKARRHYAARTSS